MKNLLFAGMVLVGFVVVGCNNDSNAQQPLVTIEAIASPTTEPTIQPTTVVTPSLPCHTADSSQKEAIVRGMFMNLNAYAIDFLTVTLQIDDDGSCIRGTFDWTMANDFVKAHPDATAEEISPTPPQQLAELEVKIGVPAGSLDSNVYWVSGTAPSDEVCRILNLRCYD